MTTYCWGATNFGACPSDNRQSTAVMALRRDPVLVSTSTPTNTSSSSRLDEFYKQIQAVTPDATLSPPGQTWKQLPTTCTGEEGCLVLQNTASRHPNDAQRLAGLLELFPSAAKRSLVSDISKPPLKQNSLTKQNAVLDASGVMEKRLKETATTVTSTESKAAQETYSVISKTPSLGLSLLAEYENIEEDDEVEATLSDSDKTSSSSGDQGHDPPQKGATALLDLPISNIPKKSNLLTCKRPSPHRDYTSFFNQLLEDLRLIRSVCAKHELELEALEKAHVDKDALRERVRLKRQQKLQQSKGQESGVPDTQTHESGSSVEPTGAENLLSAKSNNVSHLSSSTSAAPPVTGIALCNSTASVEYNTAIDKPKARDRLPETLLPDVQTQLVSRPETLCLSPVTLSLSRNSALESELETRKKRLLDRLKKLSK